MLRAIRPRSSTTTSTWSYFIIIIIITSSVHLFWARSRRHKAAEQGKNQCSKAHPALQTMVVMMMMMMKMKMMMIRELLAIINNCKFQ